MLIVVKEPTAFVIYHYTEPYSEPYRAYEPYTPRNIIPVKMEYERKAPEEYVNGPEHK